MSIVDSAPSKPSNDARRCKLLEAAITVFTRYGFRKTSMDEVARAAQISRQGLYLHFATKEELFRATLQSAMEGSLHAAKAVLGDSSLPLEPRLVRAFDAWMGRYVGTFGAGASDLEEASDALVGSVLKHHKELFVESIAKTIRGSGLLAAYKAAGLNARQLADTLAATAHGLKCTSESRAEFVERFTVAVRALCAPLRSAP
jgi:AcrR family transcriptional regulator